VIQGVGQEGPLLLVTPGFLAMAQVRNHQGWL